MNLASILALDSSWNSPLQNLCVRFSDNYFTGEGKKIVLFDSVVKECFSLSSVFNIPLLISVTLLLFL